MNVVHACGYQLSQAVAEIEILLTKKGSTNFYLAYLVQVTYSLIQDKTSNIESVPSSTSMFALAMCLFIFSSVDGGDPIQRTLRINHVVQSQFMEHSMVLRNYSVCGSSTLSDVQLIFANRKHNDFPLFRQDEYACHHVNLYQLPPSPYVFKKESICSGVMAPEDRFMYRAHSEASLKLFRDEEEGLIQCREKHKEKPLS